MKNMIKNMKKMITALLILGSMGFGINDTYAASSPIDRNSPEGSPTRTYSKNQASDEARKVQENLDRSALVSACLAIDRGANRHFKNLNGTTALTKACMENNLRHVVLLLEEKYEPNVRDKNFMTPLGIACFQDNYEIAAVLLEAGARVLMGTKDKNGKMTSPLKIADENNNPELIALLDTYEKAEAEKQIKSVKHATACRHADMNHARRARYNAENQARQAYSGGSQNSNCLQRRDPIPGEPTNTEAHEGYCNEKGEHTFKNDY